VKRAAAALLVAAMVGGAAHGKPPEQRDYDDRGQDEDGFWARVAHPNRARYRELVETARVLMANMQADRRAEQHLQEAVKLEPDEPYAHFLLGENLRAQHRFGECAAEYEEVQRIDPEYAAPGQGKGSTLISFRLAFCLALSGKLEGSIEAYGRVVGGNYVGLGLPHDAVVTHWNLGDSYHALGRLDDAIDEYKRAIEKSGATADPMVWFALGVAYDRDEQIAKAREAVLNAIHNGGYARLMNERQDIFYLPAADEDYYVGLAHLVDFDEHRNLGRRLHSIARFRRYVADAADQPWLRRAKEHLVELGPPTLTERVVEVLPSGADGRSAMTKAVLAAAPDLQKCLAGSPYSVVSLEITVAAPGAKGDRKAPANPVVKVSPLGPENPRADQLACITERARAIKLSPPAKGTAMVRAHVIAAE
jgi:tetratricopeptide (TPR) repeat protein